MATKILRKLTIRDVIGGKSAILDIAKTGRANDKATEGAPVPLMTVIGQVSSIKPGEADNGPFVKLMGVFEAVNLQTGEVISDVGVAILPNFVSTQIANAIQAGGENVQFAVQLDVKFKESAAVGYEFEARSLMPTQESDAVKAIKQSLQAAGVMLPAPKTAPQLAAPAASSAAPAASGAAAKSTGKGHK